MKSCNNKADNNLDNNLLLEISSKEFIDKFVNEEEYFNYIKLVHPKITNSQLKQYLIRNKQPTFNKIKSC